MKRDFYGIFSLNIFFLQIEIKNNFYIFTFIENREKSRRTRIRDENRDKQEATKTQQIISFRESKSTRNHDILVKHRCVLRAAKTIHKHDFCYRNCSKLNTAECEPWQQWFQFHLHRTELFISSSLLTRSCVSTCPNRVFHLPSRHNLWRRFTASASHVSLLEKL